MLIPVLLQLILVVLAAWHLTEVIRHGSLFSSFRAWIESRGSFWSELIDCGFCFSHWPAAVVVVLFAGHLVISSWGWELNPLFLLLLWLATVRLSNLLNDTTKKWNRTPSSLNTAEIEEDMDYGSSTTSENK